MLENSRLSVFRVQGFETRAALCLGFRHSRALLMFFVSRILFLVGAGS